MAVDRLQRFLLLPEGRSEARPPEAGVRFVSSGGGALWGWGGRGREWARERRRPVQSVWRAAGYGRLAACAYHCA